MTINIPGILTFLGQAAGLFGPVGTAVQAAVKVLTQVAPAANVAPTVTAVTNGLSEAQTILADIVGLFETLETAGSELTGGASVTTLAPAVVTALYAFDPGLQASLPAATLVSDINAIYSGYVSIKGALAQKAPAAPAPSVPADLPITAFSGNVSATTAYNTVLAGKGTTAQATAAAQAAVAAGGK